MAEPNSFRPAIFVAAVATAAMAGSILALIT